MRQKYLVQKRTFSYLKILWKKIILVISLNNDNLTLPQLIFCCFAQEHNAMVKDFNLRLQFCRAKYTFKFIYGVQRAKVLGVSHS